MKSGKLLKHVAGLMLLGWSVGACHKPVVEPSYPDDRGRQVADVLAGLSGVEFFGLLGWSVDGSELYYKVFYQYATADGAYVRLYALNVQTGASRLIYDGPGGINITNSNTQGGSFQSPDGQYLYLSARGRKQAGHTLYRISARQTNQAVAIDSSFDRQYPTYRPYEPSSLVSADGKWVSFQYRPDSIRLRNLVSNASVRYRAVKAIAFDPDASRVLIPLEKGTVRQTSIVSLSDFSVSPLDLSVPASQIAGPSLPDMSTLRWSPAGIRYPYTDFYAEGTSRAAVHLLLWDVAGQKRIPLWTIPPEENGLRAIVSDPSGTLLAFITTNSAQIASGSTNYLYYSTDLTTLKTTRIATVTIQASEKNANFGGLLISPDHRQLAYSIGGKVYLVPTQP